MVMLSSQKYHRNMAKIVKLLFATLLTSSLLSATNVSSAATLPACQDEDGNQVDWFLAYKFPYIKQSDAPFDTGFAYSYISNNKLGSTTGGSSSSSHSRNQHHDQQFPSSGNNYDSNDLNRNNNNQNYKDQNNNNNERHQSQGLVSKIINVFSRHPSYSNLSSTSSASGEDKFVTESLPQRSRNPRSKGRKIGDVSWIVSNKLITDQSSVVMRSLRIAYGQSGRGQSQGKINFLFYNDQEPTDASYSNDQDDDYEHETHRGRTDRSNNNRRQSKSRNDNNRRNNRRRAESTNSEKAHAKGVLIMDDITRRAIWLTHSTPQFPPLHNETLSFGDNAKMFGQTFMCINFDLGSYGSAIGKHLLTMGPNVYDHSISDRLYQLVPELKALTAKRRQKHSREDSKSVQKIKTLAGQELTLFSKSKTFDHDIYSNLMGSNLDTDLYVETWRNGNGSPLNSSCPQNNVHVNNIEDLQVRLGDNSKVTWPYSKDHSKWAISEDEKPKIVCISDINRMKSQFKRGGGSVCIRCSTCWSVFSNTILDVEPCSKSSN